MRFITAGVLAALLIGGMFVFHAQMVGYEEKWMAENADLPPVAITAMKVADWWARFWYVGSAVILLACMCVAAIIPRRRA